MIPLSSCNRLIMPIPLLLFHWGPSSKGYSMNGGNGGWFSGGAPGNYGGYLVLQKMREIYDFQKGNQKKGGSHAWGPPCFFKMSDALFTECNRSFSCQQTSIFRSTMFDHQVTQLVLRLRWRRRRVWRSLQWQLWIWGWELWWQRLRLEWRRCAHL